MSTKAIAGWKPMLAEYLNWLASAQGLSDIQRRNARRVADMYTKGIVAQRDRVYDDGAAHNQREQEKADRILDKLDDLLADAIERIQRGESNGEELLSIVSDVQRDTNRVVSMSEAAAQVEERAWEQASMAPEAFQAAALARFPALRQRLPRISDAVMEGREDPKF